MKKNTFKEISTNKEVPSELKKKVMGEIASIDLVGDIADLFTVKFATLLEEVFLSKKRDRNKEN